MTRGYKMPVFLCRWQNGDFSVVKVINKDQAIEFLDEVGNAEDCTVTPLNDFMVHFKLADDAESVLESYGEMTFEHIMRLGYPLLDKAFLDAPTDATGVLTEEGRKTIRQAVDSERERLWVQEYSSQVTYTEKCRSLARNGVRGSLGRIASRSDVTTRNRADAIEFEQ